MHGQYIVEAKSSFGGAGIRFHFGHDCVFRTYNHYPVLQAESGINVSGKGANFLNNYPIPNLLRSVLAVWLKICLQQAVGQIYAFW